MSMDPLPTRFIATRETQVLFRLLVDHGGTETILYDDLSNAIGHNVQEHPWSQRLRSARIKAERHFELVFVAVTNVGLRKMTDEEKAHLAPRSMDHVRSYTRRQVRRMVAVDFATLSNESKLAHNTGVACLGAIHLCSGQRALESVTTRVKEAGVSLPVSDTLELMKRVK